VDSLGGATFAVFDIPTARSVLDKTGFDAIQVAAAPGVSDAQLAREIAPLLPAGVDVSTSAEQSARDKQTVSQMITFIRGFLLSFGGIALFVGAFVIFNTLSMTVAQRSRELATLRTLGASRRQVLRSVIAEAALIGFAASVVGLLAGYGLAKGLTALFGAMGLDMPQGDTVFALRTVVISLLVGTVVTLLAGVVPAIRATRVAPINAVRDGAKPPRGRFARFTPIAAVATIAVAGALLTRGLMVDGLAAGDRLMNLGVGTLALFVGVAMISSSLVRPIAAVVGWPIARMRGASGELARENAVRNPSRTAATAAALMIGLALVTFVSVLGTGLADTARSDIREQVGADYVVTSASGWETFSPNVARTLAADSQTTVVSGIRQDRARVAGSAQNVSGVDPATIAAVYDFTWSEGSEASLATLDSTGAIVDRSFADEKDLAIGDRVEITSPSGDTMNRTVAGIVAQPRLAPLLGSVIVSQRAFDGTFEQ
jgi:putative ABC transport system permease protein